MCGIAVAYGKNWKYSHQALDLIGHRGPDGRAIAYLDNGYLAHTRLSIVDVEGGNQPIESAAPAQWLICNGEIYNHPELRARYTDYPYRTHSDSEDILAVYAQHQRGTPRQLEGMYAFAVVDADELFLARDPLGIKPLYYGCEDETFYFASEIKALQDIVTDVKEFPPGYSFSSKHGFIQNYDLQAVMRAIADDAGPVPDTAAVRAALRRSVNSHLMSDVPLGVFLSGGLDSSIIAALVKQEIPNLHSFSVGVAGSEDLAYARQVARHLGTQHHEYVYDERDMIAVLPDVIYYLESFDPALVRSAVANYFLARLASRYVKVILSGEGADELFSGYSYLRQFETPDALQRELVEITAELHNRNLQRLDRMTMAHGLEGRVPFLDRRFVEFAFAIPSAHKLYDYKSVEKWALRKAFEDMLPESVVWRTKQKFAEGAGSAHIFQRIAEAEISDAQFTRETQQILAQSGHRVRSKEELYYCRIFQRFFKTSTIPLVGFSRSL